MSKYNVTHPNRCHSELGSGSCFPVQTRERPHVNINHEASVDKYTTWKKYADHCLVQRFDKI